MYKKVNGVITVINEGIQSRNTMTQDWISDDE